MEAYYNIMTRKCQQEFRNKNYFKLDNHLVIRYNSKNSMEIIFGGRYMIADWNIIRLGRLRTTDGGNTP